MKSRKAEIEAEEARIKAELSTKEVQRTIERARLEAKLWEASSAVSSEPYYENLPNREPLFDNLPSSSRIPNTVHTAAPQMPVRVCSQLYSSPLVTSKMNNVPRSGQIGKNEGHALRFENEAAPDKYPDAFVQNRTTEIKDRFLPKSSVEQFDGNTMDYWAFVIGFEVNVASRIQDDLRLAYVLQHCTKLVYDKVKHIAGSRYKSFAYRMIWQELCERYGQPHVIARTAYKKYGLICNLGEAKINKPTLINYIFIFRYYLRCLYACYGQSVI